jgi:predicted Zn-dependent protease
VIKPLRIALLIGALVFVAVVALDHDPEFDLKVAGNAFRAGDMDSTLRMARLASLLAGKESQEWGSAQVFQARATLKLKHPERAKKILDRLLKAQPDHMEGLQLRGELKLLAGDAAGALEDLNHSRSIAGPGSAKPSKSQAPNIARRAQAFLKVGDLAAAIKDAETAHGLDPKHPEVLYTMSLILERQEKLAQALENMELAAHAANRRDPLFIMSDKGKQWINRLITLRQKAKVPLTRRFVPKSD